MTQHLLIALLSAMIAVIWIHPKLVKIAHLKGIVDYPDTRKLQRTPVPVLGGVAVFFGIVLGVALTSGYTNCQSLMTIVAAMMIMLYVGTMDDIVGLSAKFRLTVEIGVVALLIFVNNQYINNFDGLWGYTLIPNYVAIPLTIFAAVGIINSMNLIDGVNGLSSGYCIMASIIFGAFFLIIGDAPMTTLAAVAIGSLIPFFFHNVFGTTSKMFIGDGGTLVMGIVMSTFVVNILSSKTSTEAIDTDFGLVAFTLATMSIPIFDTLRVMLSRIVKGTSPFHPDKTHLHHMFIDMGFSHAGATVSILTLNSIIIACQILVWYIGLSVDVQLYVVIGLGIAFTLGLYHLVYSVEDENLIKRAIKRIGHATHFERKGVCLAFQKLVDKI